MLHDAPAFASMVCAAAFSVGVKGSYPMLTWNHVRRDALMMFGHVHDNWQGHRNCVNVGVDVWDFKPVRFEDIAARGAALPVSPHWTAVEPS